MSSEPTQSFDLTTGQLITLRFVIDRVFAEYFAHAQERLEAPGEFDAGMVDALVDLCEVFGVEVPR